MNWEVLTLIVLLKLDQKLQQTVILNPFFKIQILNYFSPLPTSLENQDPFLRFMSWCTDASMWLQSTMLDAVLRSCVFSSPNPLQQFLEGHFKPQNGANGMGPTRFSAEDFLEGKFSSPLPNNCFHESQKKNRIEKEDGTVLLY